MNQQIAQLNYLKIAPRKVRLLANTLKGLSAQEAEAQLLLRVQRSAKPLLKLIRSAVANAKNSKLNPDRLVISSIIVNPGPVLKRFLPRAQGRATPLLKRMSHVRLVLQESEKQIAQRFVINPPVKKKTPKKGSSKPRTEVVKKEVATKEKVGFFRRLFRRKSV